MKKNGSIEHGQNQEYLLSKDTVKKIERQVPDWEKICANHIPDKGHISEICKELSKFIVRKQNALLKKQSRDLKRYFTKDE